MEAGYLGAIVFGAVVGLSLEWARRKWGRVLASSYNNKSRAALLGQYATRIRASNFSSYAVIALWLALYGLDFVPLRSVFHAMLAMGSTVLVPLMVMCLPSFTRGRPAVAEAFVALALSQNTPPFMVLLFGALAAGLVLAGIAGLS